MYFVPRRRNLPVPTAPFPDLQPLSPGGAGGLRARNCPPHAPALPCRPQSLASQPPAGAGATGARGWRPHRGGGEALCALRSGLGARCPRGALSPGPPRPPSCPRLAGAGAGAGAGAAREAAAAVGTTGRRRRLSARNRSPLPSPRLAHRPPAAPERAEPPDPRRHERPAARRTRGAAARPRGPVMGSCVSRGEGAAGQVGGGGSGPRAQDARASPRPLQGNEGGWGTTRPARTKPHPTPPPPSPRGHGAPRGQGAGRVRGQLGESARGGHCIPSPAWNHTPAGGMKQGRFLLNSHTPPAVRLGREGGF